MNFKKEGFVNQSVLYDVPTTKAINISASLLPVKQTITVDHIELAQTIESKELHARIDIPASAFVLPNGKVATGKISVDFTPWDITANDLNAMPANGVAKDKSGKIVNLISAGMISATFKNAAGQELQLARNKTADIQMDLPLKSINNQAMKAGVSIPMWHFDEAQGLWVEEGTGYVVDSDKSSTGLAVTAKVSHFSTWNWDYKFVASGSVFVQCQSKGVGVPCNVVAKVTLEDGSGFTKANSLPAEGTTIVNMPAKGSIHWTAKDVTGQLVAEKTSGTAGNVIIDLGIPTTENLVKCILADGTAVACSGKINNQLDFSISKEGGKVISTLKDDDGLLDWNAQSSFIYDNGEWVRFKGTATSTVNGNVTIQLTEREVVYEAGKGLSYKAMCMKNDEENTGSESQPWMQIDWTGKSCEIEVQVYSSDGGSESFYFNGVYNQPIQIDLPEKYSGFSYDQSGIVSSISVTGTLLVNDWLLGTRVYLEGSEDRNQIIPLYMGPWW
ncbi:hypothetical protein KPC_3776 [Acinetobacter stercoris]|uniref:FAM171 N-terminal domain-containing protein n=1 Tax=Acinetobacter stercoris TaxID=2126983 RepID=A0A2U3N4I7_9GAMM|nr:hypothetical protein KPC_3776 [Acinetobacter stercoris]